MSRTTFDLGSEIICQIGVEDDSQTFLKLFIAPHIDFSFYIPAQHFSIYGKDGLIKLRDKLIEVLPLDNVIF